MNPEFAAVEACCRYAVLKLDCKSEEEVFVTLWGFANLFLEKLDIAYLVSCEKPWFEPRCLKIFWDTNRALEVKYRFWFVEEFSPIDVLPGINLDHHELEITLPVFDYEHDLACRVRSLIATINKAYKFKPRSQVYYSLGYVLCKMD